MNVLQFAFQRELDSEAYYRDLAGKCTDEGLKCILERLANAEVRHAEVIRQMQGKVLAKLPEDTFLADVRGMFTRMRDRGEFNFDMEQIDVYVKAQGFEKETMELYTSKAKETDDPVTRSILEKLAFQEKRHFQILQTIIEMIGRAREGGWLENAEWFHLDEY